MISKMEKFINFKQLRAVRVALADTPTGVQLNDTSANFTSQVLPNAIVWDKTTNAASGGEMYIVTAVSGPTLTLTPLGPVSAQGTGVPLGATYSIYMPEYTVRQYGQASATTANFLEDTSGVDFIAAGVKVGDSAYDITGVQTTTVTSVSATKLGVADDIFVNNDYFLISAIGPDDFDKLLRSVDVSLIENNAVAANNSRVDFTYSSVNASVADAVYAYSDTGAAGNEDMRNALQDAVVASLETPWSEVAYDFPGLLNPAGGANLTWLGGRNFFFLAISS
tara:strand:+ start:367 stop:1206 length:840 start_codon:yes stop_codon:yes gene_type:complete